MLVSASTIPATVTSVSSVLEMLKSPTPRLVISRKRKVRQNPPVRKKKFRGTRVNIWGILVQ